MENDKNFENLITWELCDPKATITGSAIVENSWGICNHIYYDLSDDYMAEEKENGNELWYKSRILQIVLRRSENNTGGMCIMSFANSTKLTQEAANVN